MALPMSHRDIQPILEALGGPPAPDDWKGGLPLTYRLGGQARLHVRIDMQTDVQPNFVVEGRLRGTERPDEWVVLGNHHDAWVFGGVDPSSGTAAMMELTSALGRLAREGVRPRRTLVFGSWDGEEVTLTGSTEWGEQFAAELREQGRRLPQRGLGGVGAVARRVGGGDAGADDRGARRRAHRPVGPQPPRRLAGIDQPRTRRCPPGRGPPMRWSSPASAAGPITPSSSTTSACRWWT